MRRFNFNLLASLTLVFAGLGVGFSQPVFTTSKVDACNATANGSITINVTASNGPLFYNIISGAFNVGPVPMGTTATVSGLAGTVAGRTYFVIVSDDDGSSSGTNPNPVIKLWPAVSATLASKTDATTCSPFNGAIDMTPSGGSGVYTYA